VSELDGARPDVLTRLDDRPDLLGALEAAFYACIVSEWRSFQRTLK